MQEYRLRRVNDVELVFNGELLADVSSRERGSTRWTEIRIYRTDSHKYVTEIVGKSTHPGEVDLITVKVASNPDDVKVTLRRKDQFEYLTKTALEALEVAAQRDPAISLVERI